MKTHFQISGWAINLDRFDAEARGNPEMSY